jgi:hypothetical protein
MKTCETCCFFGSPMGLMAWDDESSEDSSETGHHACARIIHGNGYGLKYNQLKNEPAVVTDGSGYAARLRVLPSFGCTLHESKLTRCESRESGGHQCELFDGHEGQHACHEALELFTKSRK